MIKLKNMLTEANKFKRSGKGEYMLGDYLKVVFKKISSFMYADVYLLPLSDRQTFATYTNKPIKNQKVVLDAMLDIDRRFDLTDIKWDDFKDSYKRTDDRAKMINNIHNAIMKTNSAIYRDD